MNPAVSQPPAQALVEREYAADALLDSAMYSLREEATVLAEVGAHPHLFAGERVTRDTFVAADHQSRFRMCRERVRSRNAQHEEPRRFPHVLPG